MARAGSSTSTSTTKKSAADVDAYIAAAPKAVQPRLRELRKVVRSAAPLAVEKIGYGIPVYQYRGPLASFAVWKEHIAMYGLGEAKGLERYRAEKSTLRFPIDEPIPLEKIRALLKARVRERDAAAKA